MKNTAQTNQSVNPNRCHPRVCGDLYNKLIPCVVFIFFIFPRAALATSITAIPPRLDITADPGQTLKATLKIRNDDPITQTYTINVDDFIVSDDKGTPIPVPATTSNRYSLAKWITAPSIIPVDSNGTQVVNITINVPRTALPGGHYAMVTYQANGDIKPGELQKTGNMVAYRTGTLIYVTVNGAITQNAIVKQFSTPDFHEFGPIEFATGVQNLSDSHVDPKGNIIITDFLGTKVAILPIEMGNIFPEATRSIVTNWNQKWGYGRYKAELNLAYGTAGGVLTASVLFWLFPIRLVIYILTLIISVLIIVIMLNERNKRHEASLEKEVSELREELEHLEKK